MPKPITLEGSRILRPAEFEALKGAVKKETRVWLDGLLLSGLRYVEAQRLQDNQDWLDGKFIHLPKGAVLKSKIKQAERWVRLSDRGTYVLSDFAASKKLPTYQTFNADMKRWGAAAKIDTAGLNSRCLRKTWESWLISNFRQGADVIAIMQSQGHTEKTSVEHYINTPFTQDEIKQMQSYVNGWNL